jgi:pimeloyl-ACP methyl ester carboxylesterase
MATEFTVTRGGVTLSGEETGSGPAVVLPHGLTATRRYVVMGSSALERSGHRVISYDARGHGHSDGADGPAAYAYPELIEDLRAVMDERGVERAVLAGASMGAHTLLGFALAHPERVAGLVVITPAHTDGREGSEESLARWDRLADGLRRGGVDGFIAAYGRPRVASERLERTLLTVIRQRMSQHEHLLALADALQGVPRSRPFDSIDELSSIDVPVAIMGSSDEADPEHPLAVARAYAEAIDGARLITDEPGASPLAWQGSQVSKAIADVVASARSTG